MMFSLFFLFIALFFFSTLIILSFKVKAEIITVLSEQHRVVVFCSWMNQLNGSVATVCSHVLLYINLNKYFFESD